MRKKILAAVLAATKPELMGIRGKKSGDKSSIDSSEKIEKLMTEEILIEEKSADEIVAEEIVTEEIVTEEVETSEIVADESITVEPIVEEIILKKDIIEEKSMYTYEFEGKYWLRYSDYGHKGLYFDGSKAISKTENQGTFEKDYFVEDSLINIGGESYFYEIVNGKLGLAMTRDMMGGFSYYDEVEKAEYDSIFSYYLKM
ncbi:MAG: hypothetical protein UF228_02995 [Lachnospiraceae bacterium]|nr:hypothetical protein [Lachnospiraceae bacterium]